MMYLLVIKLLIIDDSYKMNEKLRTIKNVFYRSVQK